MENELKTLRQIAKDLNVVPQGNRNTPSIQVLYMEGATDLPHAYRSIKSLADETVDKIVGNGGYPEDDAPQEWLPVADALERAGRRIRAAVQQVMAAQPTESTQVDTSRVLPAHNRTFTE
jgi:hypothetical protein